MTDDHVTPPCSECGHPLPFGVRCRSDHCSPVDIVTGIPVVTDDRMPKDTFLIQSDAARTRVFFAPAGADPAESGWTEVGTTTLDSLRFDAATEWSIGSRGDVAPVLRSLDSLKPFTLTLDAQPAHRDPYAYKRLPDAAPVDVWDVLLGEDFPGTRMAVHRAAMTRLAAACHDAVRRGAAHRAYERGEARRIAREIRATFHTSAWVRDRLADRYAYAVRDPKDFARLVGVTA